MTELLEPVKDGELTLFTGNTNTKKGKMDSTSSTPKSRLFSMKTITTGPLEFKKQDILSTTSDIHHVPNLEETLFNLSDGAKKESMNKF